MQRNNMKKIGIVLAVVLALFALLLVAVPALGVLYLQHLYAQQGPGYRLDINDWRANPFSGEFGLFGVNAVGDQETSCERIYINLDMGQLLGGQLVIEDATLQGAKLEIEQTEDALHIAGLRFNQQQQDDLHAQSNSGHYAGLQAYNLTMENVHLQIDTPTWRSALQVNNLLVPEFNRSTPRVFNVSGKTDVEYLLYEADGHRFGFNQPWQTEFNLALNGKNLRGDLSVNQVQFLLDQLPSVNMDQLVIKNMQLSENRQAAGLIGISGLLIADEYDELLQIAEYSLLNASHEGNSLQLGQQDMRDFALTVHRNENGQINGLHQLINSYHMLRQRSALQNLNNNGAEPTAPSEGLAVQTAALNITGQSHIRLIDDKLNSRFSREFQLQNLHIGPYQLNNPDSLAEINLVGGFDNNQQLNFTAALGWHNHGLQGRYQLGVNNLELSDFSPYLETYLNHGIARGESSLQSSGTINNSVLSASLNAHAPRILVRKTEDSPQRINLRLSRALDNVLSRADNQEQNIKAYLSLNGPMTDPDLALLDIAKRLLRPAIKGAVIIHNPTSNPANMVVTTLAGSDVQQLPLRAVEFRKGDMAVGKSELPYLKQVARLMQDKPALQLRLCGSAARDEAKKSPWQYLADTRAENVRSYLQKTYQLDVSRMEICPASESKQTGKVELSF
ncbi:MAG: DUF748 domain-containing protein [Oceanospirillaceae bacterium]|nr:DUF748 domain-containing protein [Oceanospirillaceae bacterium]MCP5349811.1 DUF748 domain-containing protein [Oceanospirillaceae bacterium]